MSNIYSIKNILGVDTNSNPLSVNNNLQTGDNLILNRTGAIAKRRGFDYYINSTSALATSLWEFNNQILFHCNSNKTIYYGSTPTALSGTFSSPSGSNKIRTISTRSNCYLTTAAGIVKQTSYTATPIQAGTPPALDLTAVATGNGAGWLGGSSEVAYRITWNRTDANLMAVQGAPSQNFTYTVNNLIQVTSLTRSGTTATATASGHTFINGNYVYISGETNSAYNGTFLVTVPGSGGSATFDYQVVGTPATPDPSSSISAQLKTNILITASVPGEVIANDQYQIWRTTSSASSSVAAGDTMYLIYTGTWTSGNTITYTDTTADNAISQTPLYTNANNLGIQNANYPPPLALDIENFRDYIWYANVQQPQQMILQFLGTLGLTAGTSYIKFSNGSFTETYTFANSENVSSKQFLLYTSGTPSQNILYTCQSLIRVINRQSGGNLYAEYTSGAYDLPGNMRIWSRSLTTAQWYVTCDLTATGADFSPTLSTSGTSVSSSNSAKINRIFYSQYLQPEAVPLLNYLDIGSADSAILRIIALVNSLIVVKDEGLYFISGLSAPWSVNKLNISAKCIAPNSVVALNNKVFMLTNTGVVMASEAGVQVISFPFDNTLRPLYTLSNLSSTCHAVGWESDRCYVLWMPTTASDTYATQAFVYNFFVNGWTRWTKPAQAAVIEKVSNVLYTSSGKENAILRVNATNTNADYNDETYSGTILAKYADGSLDIQYAGLAVGYGIAQGTIFNKVVTISSIGTNQYHVTTDINQYNSWSVGACYIKTPILSTVAFHPITCGEAGVSKNFLDVNLIFELNTISTINVTFNSNEQSTFTTIAYTNTPNMGWGGTGWGTSWGNPSNTQAPAIRINVPQPQTTGESLAISFTHQVANEPFTLLYISYLYDQLSTITNIGSWGQ